MDIWILSTFQLLLTALLWIIMYKFVLTSVFNFSAIYFEVVIEHSIIFLRKCPTIWYKVYNILHSRKKWSIILIFVFDHQHFSVCFSQYSLCSVWEGVVCRDIAIEHLLWYFLYCTISMNVFSSEGTVKVFKKSWCVPGCYGSLDGAPSCKPKGSPVGFPVRTHAW